MRWLVTKLLFVAVAASFSVSTVNAADDELVAAEFTINDINGKSHKLSDYRGKWVVVNYWATWCPPCLEEIPDLTEFHDKHKDTDAVVLGINTEDLTNDRLIEFTDSFLVSYPMLHGVADPNADYILGPIPAMPTTYIVSPKGQVISRRVGRITGEMIENFMVKACQDKKSNVC